MNTILITAYAVNPYKGSEEGTGWNLICEAARFNKVIAVTRKNNRGDIERYMLQQPQAIFCRIQFMYFDLPKWMIFWKKGPLLSALYFYMWQLFAALWLKRKNISFDMAHSLNFHSNWTPSFLWMLGKPFVWGPVGNHPPVPKQYIKRVYGTGAWLKDRLLWAVKWGFWNLDPFLNICRKKARKVFCVNTQAATKLRLPEHKIIGMPAVASEMPHKNNAVVKDRFTVLSVGRFVPLKGFDLTIRAFAAFFRTLNPAAQQETKLLIIGTGPEKKRLQQMIEAEEMQYAIEIKEWMPRSEVIERFQQADVFLFPSHEGAGMVVAEALSYGLPVVCLDNYGPGEYVHPRSLLKIKHGSYKHTVNQLSVALSRLYSEPPLYHEESRLALCRYEQLFQWNIKGNLFREVYRDVLKLTGNTAVEFLPAVPAAHHNSNQLNIKTI